MDKTLVIGYGNVDRQDDGAAWHILARLAKQLSELERPKRLPFRWPRARSPKS